METLLKTKKDKRQFLKWIEALRSGKYKQTKSVLQDEQGYCCLGVACKVLIPREKQKLDSNKNFLVGCFPGNQENSPEWLKIINNDFDIKKDMYLTTLNDSKGLSFKQIAVKLMSVYKKELAAIK